MSATACPGIGDGLVKMVKMDGSGWSNDTGGRQNHQQRARTLVTRVCKCARGWMEPSAKEREGRKKKTREQEPLHSAKPKTACQLFSSSSSSSLGIRTCVHRAESIHVVLVGHVVSMPRHHIEWRKALPRHKQLPLELVQTSVLVHCSILEPRHGREKVPGLGKAIRSDRPEVGKLKVAREDLSQSHRSCLMPCDELG